MNRSCEVTTFVRINNQTTVPGVCDLRDKKYQTYCSAEGLKLDLRANETIWALFYALCSNGEKLRGH